MLDGEERPSKIRKLDDSQEMKDDVQVPPQNLPPGEKNGPKGSQPPTGQEDLAVASQKQSEGKPTLSKSQLKKLRKSEQWEAGKEYRRLKRREKHKEKQARKKEQKEKQLKGGHIDERAAISPVDEGRQRPRRPIPVPVSLIMDCDFNAFMTEKELISLGAQLTRCYSDNKTNSYRTHLAISSWGGQLKTRFETVLTNNHLGWKGVKFIEKDFIGAAEELDGIMRGPDGGKLVGALAGEGNSTSETTLPGSTEPVTIQPAEIQTTQPDSRSEPQKAPTINAVSQQAPTSESDSAVDPSAPKLKPSIVYLTSDSPHTLDRLLPNTSYVVGGIVDKNRHKGICYKRACERGIATAKLPIGEYMTMQSRSVLAVNHVVEIMLKWLETGDWGEAFLSVIPKRKEAKLKVNEGNLEKDNSEDDRDVSGDEDSGGVRIGGDEE